LQSHSRAGAYCGDGQLRIWEIGTHHEYEPDEMSASRMKQWLEEGVKHSDESNYACPAGQVYLFADFLLCPTEPFLNGSAQRVVVKRASRRRYTRVEKEQQPHRNF